MHLFFLEKLLWVGSPFSDDRNQIICYSLFYMNLNFSCLVRFGIRSSHRDDLFMKSLLGMDYMLWCLISYTLMLNFRLVSQNDAFWPCPQILEMNNTLNQRVPVGPWDILKILYRQRKLWADFPGGSSDKEYTCRCRRGKRCGFSPGSGRFPGVGDGNPLQYFAGKSHGQKSTVGYSPWTAKSRTRLSDWAHKNFKAISKPGF